MTTTGTIEERYNRAMTELQKQGVLFVANIPAAVLSSLEASDVKVGYHSVDGSDLSFAAGKPKLTGADGSENISRIDARFANGADKLISKALRKEDFIVDDSNAGVLKVAMV